jgi:hypothetical protein
MPTIHDPTYIVTLRMNRLFWHLRPRDSTVRRLRHLHSAASSSTRPGAQASSVGPQYPRSTPSLFLPVRGAPSTLSFSPPPPLF